jgi:hypothetical protein
MKKGLLLFMLLLTSLATYAYDFESDGICYNITSEDDKTVEVTSGDTKYSGDVVIPETVTYSDTEYSVTTIGSDAFSYCSLKSIELPASVTTIGSHAFAFCKSLTSIKLPDSLARIVSAAFYYCTSLTSIELPASVTSIVGNPFPACSSLQEISVSEANENYTSVDGVLYDKNVSTLICYPCGKSGEFTVPSSVTAIDDYAFEYSTSLTSIELPASVTAIGERAFYECSDCA